VDQTTTRGAQPGGSETGTGHNTRGARPGRDTDGTGHNQGSTTRWERDWTWPQRAGSATGRGPRRERATTWVTNGGRDWNGITRSATRQGRDWNGPPPEGATARQRRDQDKTAARQEGGATRRRRDQDKTKLGATGTTTRGGRDQRGGDAHGHQTRAHLTHNGTGSSAAVAARGATGFEATSTWDTRPHHWDATGATRKTTGMGTRARRDRA
jgi:hypothetical protein